MEEKTFLEHLRSKTAPMHKALEEVPVSKHIMSPDLNPERYKAYLQKVHCLHRDIEQTVFPIVSEFIEDVNARIKTPAIEKDLHNMGTSAENCEVSLTDSKFSQSPAFCMGMMYVSEGSTLGGMYIVKNVSATLGDKASNAVNFLTVYGSTTGSKWKQFLADLEKFQSSCNSEEKEQIISGAIYGFERTYQIFNQ